MTAPPLRLMEEGVQARLLRAWHWTGEPLPLDLPALRRRLGLRTPRERQALATVLAQAWHAGPAGYEPRGADWQLAGTAVADHLQRTRNGGSR